MEKSLFFTLKHSRSGFKLFLCWLQQLDHLFRFLFEAEPEKFDYFHQSTSRNCLISSYFSKLIDKETELEIWSTFMSSHLASETLRFPWRRAGEPMGSGVGEEKQKHQDI